MSLNLTTMYATKPYRNAVAIQNLIMERINGKQKPEDKVLAGLARAFCDLEETKRKLKGRPLVKAVDVDKLHKSKQAHTPQEPSFSET